MSSTNYQLSFLEQLKNLFEIKPQILPTQLAFTCSKLTMEKLEQGVKYVQS